MPLLCKKQDLRYRVEVADEKQLNQALLTEEIEYIYSPIEIVHNCEQYEQFDRVIAIPPVFEPNVGDIDAIRGRGVNRLLVHTVNNFEQDMILHGGFRLNITNSSALQQYAKMGLVDSILSIELSQKRAKSLTAPIKRGMIVYGRLPLMLLRRNVARGGLTDRKGKFLPIVHKSAEYELLNPVPLVLSDKMGDFADFDFVVLKLTAGESVREILDMFINGQVYEHIGQNFTRGLYYK
jgi:putative protease